MEKNDAFRYQNISLPEDIAAVKAHGDFDKAIQLIDRRLEQQSLPEAMRFCFQMIFGPCHSYIEQPAFLFQLALSFFGKGIGILGQQPVGNVHQDDPVILQALASVDGRQHHAAGFSSAVTCQGLQLLQSLQKALLMGVVAGDRHENVQLAFIGVLAFQVLPIAHIHADAVQSLGRGITGQQGNLGI